MAYQDGRDIFVNFAPETTFGTPPAGGSASKTLRINSGALNLSKELITSNENRRDGQRTRGRHGSRSVTGSYPIDLSLGACDDLIQAVMRGTFDAGLALTGLSLTVDSVAKTITRGSGSWITDGVKVGDIVRFGAFTTTANNNVNVRVTAVTATVLTYGGTPLQTVSTAQTGVTLSRPKKCLMGTLNRSFAFEEGELDLLGSELFVGCRVGQMEVTLQPNGMFDVTFSIMGQDMQQKTGASFPYFTAPVATVALGMTAAEAVIRLGTTDVVDLTSLSFSVNLNAAGQPVVGSVLTPEVFTNLATLDGSITALRQDFTRAANFLNEDQLSLHVMAQENTAEPRNFCSFFIGNLSLSSASKSEIGSDGPRTQTLGLAIGSDDRGGAFDLGQLKYETSAP